LYTFLKMHHPKELLYIISIATTWFQFRYILISSEHLLNAQMV
jgi:hypothetical protein